MFATVRDLIRYNIEFTVGLILFLLVAVFALLSFFNPYDPTALYVVLPDMPPDATYWFGTNSRGQDLFWQLSLAVRNSLSFGLIVTILSRIISIVVGLASGYIGGWVDRVLMFVNDIFVSIPIFPLLVLFYFVFRDHLNSFTLALLMASLGWPYDARLIRSVTVGLKHREFTRHSVFAGMSTQKILFEEHLPYVMPIVFATAIANMIWAIGLEVTLAVLGFVDTSQPTIGTVLYWANRHSAMVVGVWWWILIPVIIVVVLFVGLFLLAVSLNEYIDPRSRLRRMGA